MIPVTVLTGFLGSGKTTLLAKLLRRPELARTAVIVNEFGEVGIDHDLVETSDESFVQLTTGCLCCRVRSDLVLTLQDLAARRAAGTIPAFERVVVETSGLADPASILQALMTDADVAEVYCLHNVVTTVDSLLGEATLQRHEQSVRQAAVADVLVLTKVDLAPPGKLAEKLVELNRGALVCHGTIEPAVMLGGQALDTVSRVARLGAHAPTRHNEGMASTCVIREQPISAVALALFLQALAEHCGEGLLRMKGIVHVTENPAQPAVIHGVQHVFHPPDWLDAWPEDDRRTRLVFIGNRVPSARWASTLLDMLEAEVAEELARRAA